MNETIDGRERHSLVGEYLPPFAKGLVGGDHQRAPFVSVADQFKEHARLGLILGDVGDVVENQEMIFVELGDCRFESEIAQRDLELLDEVCRSGEQHAVTIFDQSQAERGRQMRFPRSGQDRYMAPAFWRVKRQSSIHFTRLRDGRWPPQGGAFSTQASSTSRLV
jgi:hypothetical protein